MVKESVQQEELRRPIIISNELKLLTIALAVAIGLILGFVLSYVIKRHKPIKIKKFQAEVDPKSEYESYLDEVIKVPGATQTINPKNGNSIQELFNIRNSNKAIKLTASTKNQEYSSLDKDMIDSMFNCEEFKLLEYISYHVTERKKLFQTIIHISLKSKQDFLTVFKTQVINVAKQIIA